MSTTAELKKVEKKNHVVKFLDIEGNKVPWDEETITTEQLIALGGWDVTQGAIMINKNNDERTLEPGEIIKIKPGMAFGKRIRWKRGFINERIAKELSLLRTYYGDDVVYSESGDWFLIPKYPLPTNCKPNEGSVCFSLNPGYPGIEPYGFYISADILSNGEAFAAGGPPSPPPFPGQWVFISWGPEGWIATSSVVTGANLWSWARSFAERLKEGAK